MTRSPNTPRLRFTLFYYLLLVGAAAVVGPPQPPDPFTSFALNTLALTLVTVAMLGRIWCSTFVAGHKEEQLITEGPYALCRHPLYGLSILGGLGLGIATHTVVLTLVTLIVLTLLLASAARSEEKRLEERHGPAFREYVRITPRWLPHFRHGRRTLPPRVQLTPQVFWKAFLDAGSFLLLFVLIDAVRTMRDAGLLPTLLHLP